MATIPCNPTNLDLLSNDTPTQILYIYPERQSYIFIFVKVSSCSSLWAFFPPPFFPTMIAIFKRRSEICSNLPFPYRSTLGIEGHYSLSRLKSLDDLTLCLRQKSITMAIVSMLYVQALAYAPYIDHRHHQRSPPPPPAGNNQSPPQEIWSKKERWNLCWLYTKELVLMKVSGSYSAYVVQACMWWWINGTIFEWK